MTGEEWQAEVLRFWFALGPDQWFNPDPALDQKVRRNFLELWVHKRELPASAFLGDPHTALAGVILFDQFPRNMFRDSADQFATDLLALSIARTAIEEHFDHSLAPNERAFLYLPFQHSEDIADQNRSLLLFAQLGEPRHLEFARLHRDIIERFGRFPHRNALLGRKPRANEIEAGEVLPW